MNLKRIVRWIAAAGFAAVAFWWVVAGRNLGWTKTQVAMEKIEEITELRYVVYEDRFVPGLDILGASGAAALFLGCLTLLGKRHVKSPESR